MSLNDGYVYREIVRSPSGKTALAYLAGRYQHSSEAEWAARFARGEVTLGGVVLDGSEPVRTGQELLWSRPPWEEPDTPQTFEVAYEDEDLVAVVKPSGLPVLPSGGFLKNTLLRLVQERWPGAVPVHRLGRATSGLVLCAKNSQTAALLSKALREGKIERRYRALASGVASEERYEIDAPIGLVPHPRLGTTYGANPDGKPARTTATVLERRAGETLFEVQIHTGRPEQIRIHLAYIGHPLVGDPLFGPGGVPLENAPGLPGDDGYLLHAASLAFPHPDSQQQALLHAPAPPGLRSLRRSVPEVDSR